ncbi:L,D-transpeptidase family protein [Falsiroseomonas sp. HW251]|uniref:L,D-transpeptidase family protein n=1 Tax=Falsiroseomonas sp. HW251 TaxID=3390998 RepID=UPI003D316A82
MYPACTPAPLSRRGVLAGGAALAAALTGCATPEPELPRLAAPRPVDEVARLREGGPDPVVAGETLNGALLRRFYARRGFAPVWAARPAQAEALAQAVQGAADHGLDPELFHAGLLERRETLPPARRDLLLSHAFLTYADALAFGALPANRRLDAEALAAEPLDVAAVLHRAIDGPDPVAAIESLAPATPEYRQLRQALGQPRAGGSGIGQAGRLRHMQIQANLERQRWVPRTLPANRVWVNVPDQRLVLFRDDRPVFTTRVVVGAAYDRKQSPEFSTNIEAAYLNPPWIVPSDIVAADILPRLRRDPDYLRRHRMVLLPNGDAEQAPSPQSGLGVIMFDMPNRFDVYLHDTPNKAIFSQATRQASNGCIRVQNPLDLAALIFERPVADIRRDIASDPATQRHVLPRPMPVYILYHTAVVTPEGRLDFRQDFYNRDGSLWQRLQRRTA